MIDDSAGLPGRPFPQRVTLAETLKTDGQRTYMSCPWHVTEHLEPTGDTTCVGFGTEATEAPNPPRRAKQGKG